MLLNAVEWINGNVFSLLLPILVFGAGIYFAVKLRFFNILHPLQILRVFFPKKSRVKERGADKKISPFKALMLALAGTLGVGNITGVAAAIMTGGCGAIFWMWCSAIAAMLVKYAEIVLAVRSRVKICDTPGKPPKYHGGAMYYIKNKHVALIFAFLCVFGSFALGNIIQIKAAADSLSGAFGIPSFAVGIVAAIACAVIIGGGVDGIADFTAKLIPVLSLLYIVASGYIIAINHARVPQIVLNIISDAFTPRAAAGGAFGFALNRAMRFGIARGLFSNEAGCGTAPIAHAEADTKSPAAQGCFGLFEVFVDTVVLCSMTAFVVLLAFDTVGEACMSDASGMLLVIRSYSLYLGKPAEIFLALSIAFFALATVVCWAHYGLEGIFYIVNRKNGGAPRSCGTPNKIYIAAYSLCAAAGVFFTGDMIWALTDLAVGIMTTVNTVSVCAQSDAVALETRLYFSRSKNDTLQVNTEHRSGNLGTAHAARYTC